MAAHQARTMASSLSLSIPRSNHSSRSQFHKPMTVAMRSATAYGESVNSDIDAHLKQAVTIRPPIEVFQPMHHLIFSTPKTIAPALCVAACEAVGGHRTDALPAAAALHLMHVATAAHENLLLGNAAPKLQYPFGPNVELLTGDGVIPLGLELLAGHEYSDSSEDYSGRVVRVAVEITRAVGSQGMVDVQYRKFASRGSSESELLCHVKQLKEHRLKGKRSEFCACGAACGAILGGAGEAKIEKLRQWGMFVGMMKETLAEGEEDGEWRRQRVMELKGLALMELEGFDEGEIESITSLVDSFFCYDGRLLHDVGRRSGKMQAVKSTN